MLSSLSELSKSSWSSNYLDLNRLTLDIGLIQYLLYLIWPPPSFNITLWLIISFLFDFTLSEFTYNSIWSCCRGDFGGTTFVCPSENMNLLILCIWCEVKKDYKSGVSSNSLMSTDSYFYDYSCWRYWSPAEAWYSIGISMVKTVRDGSEWLINTFPLSLLAISLLLDSPIPVVLSSTFSKFCFVINSKNGRNSNFCLCGEIPLPVSATCTSSMHLFVALLSRMVARMTSLP